MRTTVDLDPDLDRSLRSLAAERGITFKEALNSTIRRGLKGETQAKKFRVNARALGLRPGVDLTKALRIADDLEDSAIVAKLELRK